MDDKKREVRGVPIRTLNYVLAGVTLVISVLLLVAIYRTIVSYREMHHATEDYIGWQASANEMQLSSDYLTEQVRCFVETGQRQYLDNYFTEAEVTRRRDRALEELQEVFGGTEAYQMLEQAMAGSVELMQREYYAMHLAILARGYDMSQFPQAVRDVVLDPEDAALTRPEQEKLARAMVFDEQYHAAKTEISDNTRRCLARLVDMLEKNQMDASDRLQTMLTQEQILIFALIAIVLIVVLLTTLQVILPLLHAVPRIRADKPLDVKGASEFRFLAATYNQMYRANLENRKHLEYEASHDALTGLYNRLAFDEFMMELDFTDTALLILDADHFKNVNDSGGHELGDAVLRRLAKALQENFRAADLICRIGGDEFAVILRPGMPEHEAQFREKVERLNEVLSRPEGEIPGFTVSGGVAFSHGAKAGDLFRRADEALYHTKQHGRHGITFAA